MYGGFIVWLQKIWNLIGHVKTKGIGKLDSIEHIPWYSYTKADKYSTCYLFLFLLQLVVHFHETDYCINLSHCLQILVEFFKIGGLKSFYTIQRKTSVSEFLFNQLVACYFFNKRLKHKRFLVDFAKLSRAPFLQEHLQTPDSVFMEHICDYNIIKFKVISQGGFSNHLLRHSEILKCRVKLFSFLPSDSLKLVTKCG